MTGEMELAWDQQGLIPVVVQDAATGEVLMVAWMNREALDATRRTGVSHFWSRSRGVLWRKGATSGHVQHVDALYTDCDRDTLLVQVHQEGAACHTGARSCFFTRVTLQGRSGAGAGEAVGRGPEGWPGPDMLDVVERVIQSRKAMPQAESYVAGLLARGEAQICRKIGEEATEVVTAALGGEGEDRVVAEVADLWFHCMVLLGGRGIALRRVFAELARRHAARTGPE